jgi:DNA primase
VIPRSRKIACPFHEERTPSFHVYRHHFKCFGCGARGDIFDFAALLWGFALPLRGRAFWDVANRLRAAV